GVAFVDPEPEHEGKEKTRDGERDEDRDGETIVLPIRHSARSNMQRMAERRERRLRERLAQRRVGVDGERHVLEPRAHLQRERKGGREFRDPLAYGVD